MTNLFSALAHDVFTFALLFVWFFPLCQVTLRTKKKRHDLKLSIALSMLAKILKPDSQVEWGNWR
ncbi:MAG: hypothetical protein E6476_05245 [Streptococcus sp.]|nr:hypothetical protein [Streptococcus sp.]